MPILLAGFDHFSDGVGELDFVCLARLGLVQEVEDSWAEDVAGGDGELAGGFGDGRLFDDVGKNEDVRRALSGLGDAVVDDFVGRDFFEGDDRRRLFAFRTRRSCAARRRTGVCADHRVAERDDEGLAADHRFGTEHRVAEAKLAALAGVEKLRSWGARRPGRRAALLCPSRGGGRSARY